MSFLKLDLGQASGSSADPESAPAMLASFDNASVTSTNADDELSSLMSEKQVPSSKSAFFHRLKRPKKSFKRAHYVPVNGRDELVRQLEMGKDSPNLDYVMKLGYHLLQGRFDYRTLRIGALLMEWGYARGVDFTLKEQVALAKAHHDIFVNSDLYAETYNLKRGKALYLDLIEKSEKKVNGFEMSEERMVALKQDFCKLLSSCGDGETLAKMSKDVLDFITKSLDKGISEYYLIRGAACKDLHDYDEAANMFFESISGTLLPGRLTRLEMLFIITRNLNQLEAERAKRENRPYTHDYQMIYLQMVQDKVVQKSVSYEQWLSTWDTWASVADKLRLLGLHNLAADLYSQGLMFDYSVFRDHIVWWKFAKAYWRCGHIPDARSAIAQAVAIHEECHQYLSVARTWLRDPNDFEEMVHMMPVIEICHMITPRKELEPTAQMKIRSLLFVARERLRQELLRKAEEERIRQREEAKLKMLEAGMTVSAAGRKRPVKDRNKQNPKVQWNNPEAIIYPSKLTPKECNAICKDMEGEFEYFPGTDSPPLPAGEHTIVVEFTPRNTKKYNCVEVQVVLIVHKAKPIVKWSDPPTLYNGEPLSGKTHLNAKLVDHPTQLNDDDDGRRRKRKKDKATMEFDAKIGNAMQMVDAPDGTFEYYLDPEDPSLELPPEDEAETRLFNDEYYINKLKDSDGNNEMDVYPWPRLEVGQRLPVGHHRVLCHFKPFDLVNYIRIRKMLFIKVVPKLIPQIVWKAPPEPLTYLTPLSKFELDAKVRKIKGSYSYFHCLTEEDIAEPAYQEELRLAALKKEEEAREDGEGALMHLEDPWIIYGVDHTKESLLAKIVKVEDVQDDGQKRKKKKKKAKKDEKSGGEENETGRLSPLGFTDNRELSAKAKSAADKSDDVGIIPSPQVDDQPVCKAYTESMELVKKKVNNGYILPSGICKLLCVFTPEDRIKYDMGVHYINVKVVQAQPEITWFKDSVPFVYTDAFFDTAEHLTAKLSDNMDKNGSGNFVYTVLTVRITRNSEEQAEKDRLDADSDDEDKKLRMENFMQLRPSGPRLCMELFEDGAAFDPNGDKIWYPSGESGEEIGLLPKGHHIIRCMYFPRDARNYHNAVFTSKVTVRCKPKIFWDEDRYTDQLRHGQAISEEQHCAYVTECPGELSYTPALGELLEVGFFQVKAKFVPEDNSIHDVSYSTRNLQIVRKIIPRVEWEIEPIFYGQPVDEENICSATSKVAGYFTYNIELGSLMDAGSYSVTATFHPEDTVTYAVSTTVNQLLVKKLAIKIEFLPEDPILDMTLTYGTPLGPAQFCAQVTFPPEDEIPNMFGIMSYSYEEGDFLPTGTNIMTATFEPLPPYDKNYIGAVSKCEIEMTKFIPAVIWEAPQAVVFGTGHLNETQLNAELLFKYIPPPGTVIPKSTTAPRSRRSRTRRTSPESRADNRELGKKSPFQYDDLNLQEPSQITEGGMQLGAGSYSYFEGGGSMTTPGQTVSEVVPQVGFDLSQVSLGIYTDYGASTIEGPSTLGPIHSVENDGSMTLHNDDNINKTSPVPHANDKSVYIQEMAPNTIEQNAEQQSAINTAQQIYLENATEQKYSNDMSESGVDLEAPSVEMGSLTIDGSYNTGSINGPVVAGASTDVVEAIGQSSSDKPRRHRLEEQDDNNAGVLEEKMTDDPTTMTGFIQKKLTEEEIEARKALPFGGVARLKIAEGSSLEPYSTAEVTHVMPNMPFDPALEAYIVGSKIRGNTGNAAIASAESNGIAIHGTFRYIPDIGHVFSQAGVYTLRAIFEPEDTLNIGTAEASVELTVLKARPTVRWKEPNPIFDSTPLSPLQLCATVHCPGLNDGVDGQMEYYPNRGEVLGLGLHVLRCRYVPFQRSVHNFDCTNSWAEVPLLVKPKPFNKEYLDNLAPKDSKLESKTKKKKAPKDTWVAGMAWPEPKVIVEESQRRKRPTTTASTERDKVTKKLLGGSESLSSGGNYGQVRKAKPMGPEYKLSDEWEISPRTKQEADTLSNNIYAAADARELLNLHERGARNFSPSEVMKMKRAHTSPDTAFLPSLSPVGAHQSPVGKTPTRRLLSGDDLVDQNYVEAQEDIMDGDFATSFHNSFHSHFESSEENLDFQSIETPKDGAGNGATVDIYGRPIHASDSDRNNPEWQSAYAGEKVDYPDNGAYSKIGKELNFTGGIPLDITGKNRAATAQAQIESVQTPKTSTGLNYGVGAANSDEYLLNNLDSKQYIKGAESKLNSSKMFHISGVKKRAKTTDSKQRPPKPGMHFGTGNSGKNTSQTIDDLMKKQGKTTKIEPFRWNFHVDVRNVFDDKKVARVRGNKVHKIQHKEKEKREDKFRPLESGDLDRQVVLDKELDEEAARRQLVRLERQINSLRRDAFGIAKMVTYAEKMRAQTTGRIARSGNHSQDTNADDSYDSDDFNPYTGEYGTGNYDESLVENNDNVGIQGDPQGLNRIPGIGTGAAKRVVNSYDMAHPYLDITVHSLNKQQPTAEATLYNTGVWPGGFKDTYAVSTSASDRLTDTATMFKGARNSKTFKKDKTPPRPRTTGVGHRHENTGKIPSNSEPSVNKTREAFFTRDTSAQYSTDVVPASLLGNDSRIPPRPGGNAVNLVRSHKGSRPGTVQ